MSNNPFPLRGFDIEAIGKVMASHGYDQLVIYGCKDGEAETFTHVGIDGKHAQIAKAKEEAFKALVESSSSRDEARSIDEQAQAAMKEMATGPEHDPDYGKRLVVLERSKKERGRTGELGGNVKLMRDAAGVKPAFKTEGEVDAE